MEKTIRKWTGEEQRVSEEGRAWKQPFQNGEQVTT